MRRASLIASLTLLLLGCGGDPDILKLNFIDALVEAPARSVRVAAVTDASCQRLLTVPHEQLDDVATVILRRSAPYPVNPKEDVLEGLPRDQSLAIDVSVLDATSTQITRACVDDVQLQSSQSTVEVEVHGLARCAERAKSLDLALVLDTSLGMRAANIGVENQLIASLQTFVENMGVPGGEVRFSIITHGHTEPSEWLAPTTDREAVVAALEALRDTAGGTALHFEGLEVGAKQLRARAVCGRRPALLWIGGGSDESSPQAFQLATIGVVATRGEPFDDIFIFGFGISENAVGAMRDLADDVDLATVEGALSAAALRETLLNAHLRLQSLLQSI